MPFTQKKIVLKLSFFVKKSKCIGSIFKIIDYQIALQSLQAEWQLINVIYCLQHSYQSRHNTIRSIKQHFCWYSRYVLLNLIFWCYHWCWLFLVFFCLQVSLQPKVRRYQIKRSNWLCTRKGVTRFVRMMGVALQAEQCAKE